MASQSQLTQCPHCGSQFEVSTEHLSVANGQVRCGSCMQVFKADDYFVVSTPSVDIPTVGSPIAPPPPNVATPPQGNGIKMDGHDDDWAPPPANDNMLEKNNTTISLGSIELSDMLGDLSDDQDSQPKRDIEPLFSDDAFGDVAAQEGNQSIIDDDNFADESWATALIEEEEKEEAQNQADLNPDHLSLIPKAGDTGDAEESPARANKNFEDDGPFTDIPFSEPLTDASLFDTPEDTDFDFLDSSTDFVIEQPSIVFEDNTDQSPLNWINVAKWGSLSAAACLLFVIQYALFNFTTLAKIEQHRSSYAALCQAVGCQLPEVVDTHAIQGANLVVRSNPKLANSLIIDAIMINHAAFGQPFPKVELSFSDRGGNILATRQFMPKEYLSGELKEFGFMPVNTPLHISMDIIDPGVDAVGYVLQFYPDH